jgi:hypothetical protein
MSSKGGSVVSVEMHDAERRIEAAGFSFSLFPSGGMQLRSCRSNGNVIFLLTGHFSGIVFGPREK